MCFLHSVRAAVNLEGVYVCAGNVIVSVLTAIHSRRNNRPRDTFPGDVGTND